MEKKIIEKITPKKKKPHNKTTHTMS